MGRTSHDTRRRRAIGASILAGIVSLSACSAGGDDSAADDSATMEPAATEMPAEEPAEAAADDGFAVAGDGEGDLGDTTAIDLGRIGRDVIVEMRVTVSSDDIQRSVSAVSARAAALGGGVASSEVDFGGQAFDEAAGGYAVLVVKVPPGAVDDLLAGLEQTGTIQSINQSAQDVTEQLIDLDVRIDNARESVANVRDFMERAEDLNDLVTLESELTRRQTELERLEAQQRNLGERVAFSTVTVEIIPTAAVPEPPDEDDDTIGDAFRQGWDGFTAMIFGIGFVLAVLAPFLVAAAVIGAVVLLVVRRRRRRTDPWPTADPGPDVVSSASDTPPVHEPDETTS